MTTKTKTPTAAEVSEKLKNRNVTKSKGAFTVRKGYFYRHGYTTQMLVDEVKAAFPEAVIKDSGDIFKPFIGGAPIAKQSHWYVTFTL